MLNGKFFTGLPPKMIDRRSDSGRNRMESHLFWPDDTKVDTAVESRIKRRNSVQLACSERPLYEKQSSVIDDVDTRKRFSKEFSQSSIQFYDNLNDNSANSRRSMLRNSVGNKKMEIAEKPTNTKLQLPDNIVNKDYTAAKKKQAYTSEIKFYDYANDREEEYLNTRNNLRKPKMDMNDKREMELNSKNSPKLQVKRDARSLSEEKEPLKINNQEVRTMDRPTRINHNNIIHQAERFVNIQENDLRNRKSVEPRMNHSPKRGLAKSAVNRQQRYSSDKEIYREPLPLPHESRKSEYYENCEGRDFRRNTKEPTENFDDNSSYRGEGQEPKRIIRNNTTQYYDVSDDKDYSQEYLTDEKIRIKMRDIQLKSPPLQSPRKQYYSLENYYDDESQYNYIQKDQVEAPTKRGSSHRHFEYIDIQGNVADLPYKDYKNIPKRLSVENPPVNKINNQFEQEPVASPVSPSPSDADSSVSATKLQTHLRSSLCFNNGEIIGGNDAGRSPTSSKHQVQRRNARSSATQRVSVGLPG